MGASLCQLRDGYGGRQIFKVPFLQKIQQILPQRFKDFFHGFKLRLHSGLEPQKCNESVLLQI